MAPSGFKWIIALLMGVQHKTALIYSFYGVSSHSFSLFVAGNTSEWFDDVAFGLMLPRILWGLTWGGPSRGHQQKRLEPAGRFQDLKTSVVLLLCLIIRLRNTDRYRQRNKRLQTAMLQDPTVPENLKWSGDNKVVIFRSGKIIKRVES